MTMFFSCDWGTSSFRLRLVNAENARVVSEVKNTHGIAAVHESWKQTGGSGEEKTRFYSHYLFEEVKKIQHSSDYFNTVPLIISGMASSSIGMLELPYKTIPFVCDGSDLMMQTLEASHGAAAPFTIISGVRSETDVMRGEETILAGCNVPCDAQERLFIFPGTHSKHITVSKGTAQHFTTFITGELFDLLSKKSILAASVEQSDLRDNDDAAFFIEGVKKGASLNLLNSVFQVRTNQLFNTITPAQNYHYLSGLLLGHELKDIKNNPPHSITLVCGDSLKSHYMKAFGALSLQNNLSYINADEALVKGHCTIHRKLFSSRS